MGVIKDLSDELDEWEPPTQGQSVFRLSLALILISALVFNIANHKDMMNDPGYEVVSVSKGALQVVDRETGNRTELRDQDLVKKALAGEIRRGDIVYE